MKHDASDHFLMMMLMMMPAGGVKMTKEKYFSKSEFGWFCGQFPAELSIMVSHNTFVCLHFLLPSQHQSLVVHL